MIRVGILGDIGSGKIYVSKRFGYPVFNADEEVDKIYKKDMRTFNKLKKVLPKYLESFPINKNEILKAILSNKNNLKKIIKIVHPEVKKKMNFFLKKNRNKKIVILDIPLLLENNLNKKNDVLVFVESPQKEILKRLRKRKNFNKDLLKKFKCIQLSLDYKKKKSQFIIKNKFDKKYVRNSVHNILKEIL